MMTKVVNSFTAKMELGALMIAIYLLGNPDHYTSHHFIPFFWSAFAQDVEKAWSAKVTEDEILKVMLIRNEDRIVGLSIIYDYIYHGLELDDMCIYNWISRCKHEKVRSDWKEEFFEDAINGNADQDDSPFKEPMPKKHTNLYAFLHDHLLSKSHATRCSMLRQRFDPMSKQQALLYLSVLFCSVLSYPLCKVGI